MCSWHGHPGSISSPTRWPAARSAVRLRWHANGKDQEEKNVLPENAARRAAEITARLLGGDAPLSSQGKDKLCDFAARHLAMQTHQGLPLSPTTMDGYEGLLRRNINARLSAQVDGHRVVMCLGDMPLKRITSTVVETWYVMVATAKSQDRAAKSYRLLHGIFTRAVREREVPINPCQMKGAGSEHAEERELPEDDETPQHLADALGDFRDSYGRRSRDRYKAIPLVAGFGGGLRLS